MDNAGDAAEQIVRMSLEGTEVALKLTGSAVKNIAAALYAVLKNRDKNRIQGRQRLSAMLKSGKELKVFSIREQRLKQFAAEAKRYGVVYCALRGKRPAADGVTDILVRAEDAAKINRIVERFQLAAVDTDIRSENGRGEKEVGPNETAANGIRKTDEQLLEELLTSPVQSPAAPQEQTADTTSTPDAKDRPLSFKSETDVPQNPLPARTGRAQQASPSGPVFAPPAKNAMDADPTRRPSIRRILRSMIVERMTAGKKARQAPATAVHNKTDAPTQVSVTEPGRKHEHTVKPKERVRA